MVVPGGEGTSPFSGSMPNLSGFSNIESWTGENFQAHNGLWTDYVWLLIFGAIAAFMASWGIGANDVANSFATSVGAKSVTMFQACIIAGVFEFVGAVSLGGSVTSTVKGSITDPANFAEEPQIFAYGMLCAAISIGLVLFIATYLKAPVSTTHTAIGSVLGFGLVYGGADGVNWNSETDEFPFRSGFTPVVISWFLSPVITGIVSSIIFLVTRTVVLRRENSYAISFYFLPLCVTITIFIILLAIFLKGVSEEELDWDDDKKTWVAAIVGAGCGFISIFYVVWLKRKMMREDNAVYQDTIDRDAEAAHVAAGGIPKDKAQEEHVPTRAERFMTWFNRTWFGQRPMVKNFVEAMTYDVHAHVASMEDPKVAQLHADAEVFDPRTEDVFKHLQVCTACGVAFVHGANDVANGVGPLAGIWDVYNNYKSSSKAQQPRWILVLGAIGIVFGLAMYGYRIIATLGVDLVVMTPSRGYSTELAATVVIAIASVYGLPISTTQVVTGGEVGVGMCETWKMTGVNWLLFLRTFFGWVGALVLGAIVSAALFSVGVYGPSVTNMDYVKRYQHAMHDQSLSALTVLMNNCAGKVPSCTMSDPSDDCIAASCEVDGTPYTFGDLLGLRNNLETLFDFDSNGAINKYNMIFVFKQISSLYQATFKPEAQ